MDATKPACAEVVYPPDYPFAEPCCTTTGMAFTVL